MTMEGLVQVAGIASLAEGRMLLDCGVDLLGFPLRLPVHATDTSEDEARAIIAELGPSFCVLITYEQDPDRLVEFCRFLNVTTVQLHADVSADTLAQIRTRLPLRIFKSYVVGRESMSPARFAQIYSPVCEAFITDTFDPSTGASGATGLVHDWGVSAELVRHSPRPVILAGGLNPANVRQAIRSVRPAAVDVHTGVEAPDGSKDPELVRAFVREARAGFAEAAGY
ncbi:MAG: phosphoribosylanthranilate isomerase [Desulfomicrobium apsheronum]|jgi:phosphoribosylanthranilate isomerase|nr:phosphoribosylanthranilate isomerase [Desulfomicrobium apsheronum]